MKKQISTVVALCLSVCMLVCALSVYGSNSRLSEQNLINSSLGDIFYNTNTEGSGDISGDSPIILRPEDEVNLGGGQVGDGVEFFEEGEILGEEYPYGMAEEENIREVSLKSTVAFPKNHFTKEDNVFSIKQGHSSSASTFILGFDNFDPEDALALKFYIDNSDNYIQSLLRFAINMPTATRFKYGGYFYLISDSGKYYKVGHSAWYSCDIPAEFSGYVVIPFSQLEFVSGEGTPNPADIKSMLVQFQYVDRDIYKAMKIGNFSLVLDPKYTVVETYDEKYVSIETVASDSVSYLTNQKDLLDNFDTTRLVKNLGKYMSSQVIDGRYKLPLNYLGAKNGVQILTDSSSIGYQAFSIEIDNSMNTDPIWLKLIANTSDTAAGMKQNAILYLKDKYGTAYKYQNTNETVSVMIPGGFKGDVIIPFDQFIYTENGKVLSAGDVNGLEVYFSNAVKGEDKYILLDNFSYVRANLNNYQILDVDYRFHMKETAVYNDFASKSTISTWNGIETSAISHTNGRLKVNLAHSGSMATFSVSGTGTGKDMLAMSFEIDNTEGDSAAQIKPLISTSKNYASFVVGGHYFKINDTGIYKMPHGTEKTILVNAGEKATIVLPFDQFAYASTGLYVDPATVNGIWFQLQNVQRDSSKNLYIDNIEYIKRDAMPTGVIKQLPIGGGGYVTGVVIHPLDESIKYIRTDVGGAYRWDGPNNTWVPMTHVFGNKSIQYCIDGIAIDPNNKDIVYLCIGNSEKNAGTHGIYKSTDRGATWTVLQRDVWFYGNGSNRANGEPIVVDPNNSNVIYVASRISGMLRTIDGGKNWTTVSIPHNSSGDGNGTMRSMAIDPNITANGRTRRVYVARKTMGVYMSDDGGDTYSLIPGSPVSVNTIEVASNGYLYMTSDEGVFVYKNGVVTEISPSQTSKKLYRAIDTDPNDPNRIIVSHLENGSADCMNLNIYYSKDGGATWTQKNNNMTKKDKLVWWPGYYFSSATADLCFNPHNPREVWMSDWYGVWVADNIDDTKIDWYLKVRGHEECVIWDMATLPLGPVEFLFGTADNDGMYYEDVNEYPLKRRGCQTRYIAFCETKPNYVAFIGADNNSVYGSVCISKDFGKTFTSSAAWGGLPAESAAFSYSDEKNMVVLPVGGVPKYTTDGGVTWHDSMGAPVNESGSWGESSLIMPDGLTDGVFYYSAADGFYRSTDKGATWTLMNNSSTIIGGQLETLPGTANTLYVTKSNKLFITTDGGANWTQVTSATVRYMSLGKGKEDGTFAMYMTGVVGGVDGLFISDDMGATWTLMFKRDQLAKFNDVEGDRQVYGRCFLGSGGLGIIIAYK